MRVYYGLDFFPLASWAKRNQRHKYHVSAAFISAAAALLNGNDDDAFHAPADNVYAASATDHDATPDGVDADDEDHGLTAFTDDCDDASVDGDDPRRE